MNSPAAGHNHNSFHAWCEVFRLPNLPSAPGDALAGAAWLSLLHPGIPDSQILGIAFSALFFYMAGISQNDWVDAQQDEENAPRRPIPSGRLSKRQVGSVSIICFLFAFGIAAATHLPWQWFASALLLTVLITAYNTLKERLPRFGLIAMGLCRGANVLCGASLLMRDLKDLLPVLPLAIGWTAYISAVTWIAADEERAEKPVSGIRYLLGLTACIPLLGFLFMVPHGPLSFYPPVAGVLATLVIWYSSVAPLGVPHTPEIRRKAIGQTIGALLYLQAGFILLASPILFPILMACCIVLRRLIRRQAPSISGS